MDTRIRRPNESDTEFAARMQRIRSSLEGINNLMRALKSASRAEMQPIPKREAPRLRLVK